MPIWQSELVQGRGQEARYLLPERASRHGSRAQLERVLREAIASGDIQAEWDATKLERDEAYRKKVRQQKISSTVRQDVAAYLKSSPKGKPVEPSFAKFREAELLLAGAHLMKLVDARRHAALSDVWRQAPGRYPFYTGFVEGLLYAHWYAAVEHNKPIDANAQADYEQLAYLTWADMVVTNDTQFQRHVFGELWKPRGK